MHFTDWWLSSYTWHPLISAIYASDTLVQEAMHQFKKCQTYAARGSKEVNTSSVSCNPWSIATLGYCLQLSTFQLNCSLYAYTHTDRHTHTYTIYVTTKAHLYKSSVMSLKESPRHSPSKANSTIQPCAWFITELYFPHLSIHLSMITFPKHHLHANVCLGELLQGSVRICKNVF